MGETFAQMPVKSPMAVAIGYTLGSRNLGPVVQWHQAVAEGVSEILCVRRFTELAVG
jgi:hypothetical protein